MQTLIRLLFRRVSDLGLHCFSSCPVPIYKGHYGKYKSLNLYGAKNLMKIFVSAKLQNMCHSLYHMENSRLEGK